MFKHHLFIDECFFGMFPRLLIFFLVLCPLSLANGAKVSALRIIDYQRKLNPRFEKQVRSQTRFIIIHSTESSLPSALRTLSRGKVWDGRYVTRGGHAHYLISRSGVIYRILDPKYWGNHAGVSMWHGYENLSDCSVGIELEGYHDVAFSHAQYTSLGQLLSILQKRYGVEDRDVLEHWRIAYSAPNRYHHDRVRGRKSDPGINNFDRVKAGLTDAYSIDPDVVAGRISSGSALMKAGGHMPANVTEEDEDNQDMEIPSEVLPRRNMITSTRTAWQIAGTKYSSPSTQYLLPDGRSMFGNQIADWTDIPSGTEVILGSNAGAIKKVVSEFDAKTIVPQISSAQSAWKIANALYNSSITYYLLPNGSVLSGAELSEVSNLPEGTRVLVAYRLIKSPQKSSPLGEELNATFVSPQTLYLFPDGVLRSGDQIEDFSKLPKGLRVFTKID